MNVARAEPRIRTTDRTRARFVIARGLRILIYLSLAIQRRSIPRIFNSDDQLISILIFQYL